MMIEVTSTITSKGQVTVPKRVRQALGVEATERITFVIHDSGQVELRPTAFEWKDLRGIVAPVAGADTACIDDMFAKGFQERADSLMSGYDS